MTQYLALLRGINVGGNNIIKMADLKSCFEAAGFDAVQTYIQSGNVVFCAPEAEPGQIAARIEDGLAETFGVSVAVLVCDHARLKAIVEGAPAGFGDEPATYRYNVIFMMGPATADELLQSVKPKEGVDQGFAGDGVCYFWNLIARATQSRLSRIVGTPIYQYVTIRNWNTTTRLLALMDSRAGSSKGML
ncbi:MAG: hypothetical protein AVDCRST_MAG77-3430 [uncultured Chloroflexi bacterium]|uniref:DUF1697 domain-containing protein n=1 Tax=uncultured Chloroflexota bacterium TaxID=166587 RepID=A0A6J4JBF0_9CHLR|nr:MAG: hypothetical protein AVDCRST_MAG77-3430 [uncultured Chloroflexota bacterium]